MASPAFVVKTTKEIMLPLQTWVSNGRNKFKKEQWDEINIR